MSVSFPGCVSVPASGSSGPNTLAILQSRIEGHSVIRLTTTPCFWRLEFAMCSLCAISSTVIHVFAAKFLQYKWCAMPFDRLVLEGGTAWRASWHVLWRLNMLNPDVQLYAFPWDRIMEKGGWFWSQRRCLFNWFGLPSKTLYSFLFYKYLSMYNVYIYIYIFVTYCFCVLI